MKKLLLYIFILQAIVFFAQDGFVPGYVVTYKGDTMKGKIKDRKYPKSTTSWQKIDFIDSAGNKFGYDPEEIKEYIRIGKTRYYSLNIGVTSKPTFLEVQQEGAVILYAYNRGTWGGAGMAIVVKTSETGPKEHVEFFLQKKNQPNSLMQWRPGDYERTAKVFFKDNEELLKQIETGTLKEEDIFEIVKKYNESKK
ncbi:MAG TPA: hypothetical protein VNZ49_03345 [Bacteroidia bacterium]|jgi:hypothetical protein|nr:hypothetical protein [Bacteroidia bacterium]